MKQGKHGAYDWRQTISRTKGRIERQGSADLWWYDGTVATPLGYVTVYSQRDYTSCRAIVNGVEYVYTERCGHPPRGLAVVAAKFIARLHEEVA